MSNDRPTLLVIDDAPSNIEVIRNILVDTYRVKVATNGPAGIKIAQKEPHPDLILLDIVMPDMDGYAVCRQLKENPVTASIPVLFVTGTADDEEKLKGLAMGAKGFLMKPLQSEAVLDAVAKSIRRL